MQAEEECREPQLGLEITRITTFGTIRIKVPAIMVAITRLQYQFTKYT